MLCFLREFVETLVSVLDGENVHVVEVHLRAVALRDLASAFTDDAEGFIEWDGLLVHDSALNGGDVGFFSLAGFPDELVDVALLLGSKDLLQGRIYGFLDLVHAGLFFELGLVHVLLKLLKDLVLSGGVSESEDRLPS